MKNQFVADILYMIADLLDLKGEIFFKTRAYRIAAQTIEALDEDIEKLVNQGRLESIPGVGEALAKKITELVQTGKIEYLERLKKEVPTGLIDLLGIPGLGPKKVAALYKNLGITDTQALREAASKGELRTLEGFGEITERNILRGIQLREKTSGRVLLNVAYEDGTRYITYLKRCKQIEKINIAGSLRRMKETIGDLDILISSKNPETVMEYFVSYPDVAQVLAKGTTKSSVLLNDNLQVDLRVVEEKSYGAALQYFTGSKDHNITLRGLAIRKGYKLNEYGLFDKNTEKYIAGKTEEEIYKKVGFPYIEPELRENRGEFEAAKKKKLPNLVGYDELNGDFHVHSSWSDGSDSIETIASVAQQRRYSFIGITDHSQSLKIANGLTEDRIQKKLQEIKTLNKKFPDLRILCGTECDIKTDGTLDYSNKILKQFDFVYIGIHTAFKMDKETMTKRIIKGMDNEQADFVAHPTGRLIGKREPYEVDLEQIIDTAKETDTRLEINSFPDRLDLDDTHVKLAKEHGVQFVLGTDSHSINHLDFMRFGIATARRGWLEKKDILNTYSLKDIEKILGA
ncbi:MAG: DNA polymerase/3'-5' exonuclease PolX [Thermoplasmata archaeon]|nr:DNA polymerase/3'-5' exonuclease PolX [Thermoplasmata archaeon]MBE3137806.1 DNA polymerase/3'-5' exonuclease PolX [Thermoplasmata archaeon]